MQNRIVTAFARPAPELVKELDGMQSALVHEALNKRGALNSTKIRSYWKNFVEPQDLGFFMGVWSIASFMPVAEFKARMDALIEEMKSCPPAPGSNAVLIPGEIEHANTVRCLRDGIEVGDQVVADLKGLADEYAVSFT